MRVVDELRRADVRLPAADARAIDGQWEKQIRVADGVMVEKIARSSAEIIERSGPSAIRDDQTNVVLLIALAVQRQEIKVLRLGKFKDLSCHCIERRSLVVARVRPAQHPTQS